MTTRPAADAAHEARWGKTACILCECNCGLEVQVADRNLVKIRGDKDHPGSAGYTCEKPLRLDKYQSDPHRLRAPLRRRQDGTFEEIDWDTALDEIAVRLAAVRDEHGGETIFFYGGGGQGNHLGGAYGRALLHAVGARFMSNALAQEKTGEGWVDQQLHGNHTAGDFERTEVAIFIGKNPWQSHGVARARPVLRELARDPDRAIIVIDPRVSETAAMADIHLQVAPGTDAWCVAALAATLVQEELTAQDWLDQHTVGIEQVLSALGAIDVGDYARRCGVPEEQIRAAARRIAAAESAATYEDLGVQQSPNSTLVSYLNKMLWILTGNFAKPGGVHPHSWVFPIAGRWHPIPRADGPPRGDRLRRALGLAAMRWGARPLRRAMALAARGRGSRLADRIADATLRLFFESVAVPSARHIADTLGRSNIEGSTPVSGARVIGGLIPCNAIADEILTDHPDRFRAMWIDASNPVHSLAESERFRLAMSTLDLSVVVDVALTETARCADYVLPAASQFEKYESSLFTLHFPHNVFQVRAPLLDPLPGTRPEPEIYAAIVDRLGVVEDTLIAELTAAARVSRRAFALAFFATVRRRPELAGLAPYLLYRTLGATLPATEKPVALIWGMAQLCAIAHPDAVVRAGFTARGFDLGEQLFEAFRTRREGVLFTEDRYADAWNYIQHPDRKIHAAIPELLAELARIDGVEPSYTTAEFPFVLSAGERRSFTANVIIRDPEWRRRDKQGALRVCPADATELGVATGDVVRVVTENGSALTPVEVTDIMQAGHISLPNGMGVSYPGENGAEAVGVAPNSLTSAARRDKFFGTPWHKTVPARIEVLAEHTAPGARP
ncbi:molybdopterin-dependent oxidoreductase [Amycolatopsis cihanbeyliensis]|uniref:Anaerobic selenocysteine-containing dehydrogenase n=1 Tax=Amycolatopsis cihanbeyliensis TaxID=1128664 RepID=A0A542CU20_AMYCI|nr:molybdopterin-dependent oxidoreductase [Amycolatopsis cihanbeyliensis]TQI94318.1 anaerobic selenocysteine-containing dehydrogenase [Amycolatopsis cihanbeyliensis]